MIQSGKVTGRFGIHASVIQLLGWALTSALDAGITQGAFALASLLFWVCAASLLRWRRGLLSRVEQLLLRWSLIPFIVIGTPLLRPMFGRWEWLQALLYPVLAALIVLPLMYLVARLFGWQSPFEGAPSTSDE